MDQKQARQIRSLDTPTQWMSFYWDKITARMSHLIEDQLTVIQQRWGTPLTREPYLAQLQHHALLDVGQRSSELKSVLSDSDEPLSDELEALVAGLTSSHLSCYEVTACRRGEYLEVCDKLSGSTHIVYDSDLSQRLEPREAIMARLVSINEADQILPGWLKLQFWRRKKLYANVLHQFEEMGANLSDSEEMKILLKRQPELLVGALLELDALCSESTTTP